jgi:diguanylate cyclase (GGDEF)-like protein
MTLLLRLLSPVARPVRARAATGFVSTLAALCAVVLLWLSPAARAGETPLALTAGAQVLDAWPAISVLSDPTHVLTVQDAMERRGDFRAPSQRGGTLGTGSENALWLRVPLAVPPASGEEHGAPPGWVANIDYSSLQQVDFYLTQEGRVLQTALLGYQRRPGLESLASRTPSMALAVAQPGNYELYLRVQTLGPLILPITISETPYRLHLALREQMLQGLLNGLAFCLLVYSVLQSAGMRDRLFAYYALVVVGSAGFSLQFFGIGSQYLWRGNLWLEQHVAIASGLLALIGSFLFLCHALASDAPRSIFARLMNAGAALTTLLLAAYLLDLMTPRTGTAILSLLGPVPSLLSIPAAVRRARQKDPVGATLLVAWSVYLMAAMVMVGLAQGWLPANFWTLHGFQFGATIDMILFLRVLGLRAQAMRKAAQEALHERDVMHSLAHSDPLTGLNNRRGLQHALRGALASCAPHSIVAVYLLDLDGFKPVNDAFGHDVGDDLLVAVGQRLQANIRQHTDLVARLGGDEFIIMACNLGSPADADEVGRSLLRAFDTPFALREHRIQVGLTIGYALAPLDSDDPQGLIRLADAAMYAGKQSGKCSIRRHPGDLAVST